MPILTLILVIVIVGVVLWAVNAYIPMAPPVKNILNIVVILLLVIWLITLIVPGLGSVRVGR